MKFEIEKQRFLEELNIVTRSIDSFSPLPVLSGILIEVEENRIILTGSNGKTSIRSVIKEVEVFETGSIVLESKYILDVVKKSKAGFIEVSNVEMTAIIRSGRSKIRLNGIPCEEYPKINWSKADNHFLVKFNEFNKKVEKVIYAASADPRERRPVLAGINLSCENNDLRILASDAKRGAITRMDIYESMAFDITVPKKTFEIAKIMHFDEVDVYVNKNKIQFMDENRWIQSELIGGIFPDLNRVIPTKFVSSLVVDKKEVIEAIDRCSFNKIESIIPVRFVISKNESIIKTNSTEAGDTEEYLEYSEYDGDGEEFTINGQFIVDCFKHMESDKVKINISGKAHSGYYAPFVVEGDKDKDSTIMFTALKTYN